MATGIPVTVGELVDTPTINTWARGYLRKTTSKAVNSTTGKTDLLNGEFNLPAGAMGTDKVVRLTAWGDWKQNAGSSKDIPRFSVDLGTTGGGGGGATLIDTGNIGFAVCLNLTNRYPWRIVCEIRNLGSASSQEATFAGRLMYAYDSGTASAAFVTGTGFTYADANVTVTYDGYGTGSVDTASADRGVLLNVVNASGSANYETKLLGALIEVI